MARSLVCPCALIATKGRRWRSARWPTFLAAQLAPAGAGRRAALRALAGELKLAARVHFGRRPRPPPTLFSAADAVVPSEQNWHTFD